MIACDYCKQCTARKGPAYLSFYNSQINLIITLATKYYKLNYIIQFTV